MGACVGGERYRLGCSGTAATGDGPVELNEKIQRTDALVDEIVHDLYGLTDGEIVGAAVGG